MKIGFSLGRCVRDIVTGAVDLDDVVLIAARTRIETKEAIRPVITHYVKYEGLYGLDLDECMVVTNTLWDTGRLHQPRLFANFASQIPDHFVWMDLAPSANSDNEAVRKAWVSYQMALKLSADHVPSARAAREIKL